MLPVIILLYPPYYFIKASWGGGEDCDSLDECCDDNINSNLDGECGKCFHCLCLNWCILLLGLIVAALVFPFAYIYLFFRYGRILISVLYRWCRSCNWNCCKPLDI